MRRKKVIVGCIGGMVRSSGICDILRNGYAVDAIAFSLVNMSREAQDELLDWADHCIVVEPRLENEVPEQYQDAWYSSPVWTYGTILFNLGADIWGNARAPELRKIILDRIASGELDQVIK